MTSMLLILYHLLKLRVLTHKQSVRQLLTLFVHTDKDSYIGWPVSSLTLCSCILLIVSINYVNYFIETLSEIQLHSVRLHMGHPVAHPPPSSTTTFFPSPDPHPRLFRQRGLNATPGDNVWVQLTRCWAELHSPPSTEEVEEGSGVITG